MHWERNVVEFSVNNNGAGDGLNFNQTETAVASAFQRWEQVGCTDITFVNRGSTTTRRAASDNNNTTFWAESGDPEFSGPGAILGTGIYAVTIITIVDNQDIVDVDIAYNGRDFNWSNTGAVSIEGIAAHENGHMLGLHHSEVTSTPAPTMRASIAQNNTPQQASLEKDDRNAICYNYPTIAGSSSQIAGDFNGDGIEDLAIGVPGEAIGTTLNAGAVNVIYGSAAGLSASGNQLWHQDSNGIAGAAETEDRFGAALASGDFNRDGFDDLAIGVINEAIGSIAGAGAVNIIYGSASGLSATGNQVWHQDVSGIGGASEVDDHFGAALASGDFDNDGFDDLAIGVPNEAIGSLVGAGAVNVLYGTSAGLSATASQLWHQDSSNIVGAAEAGDRFGAALAAGDFDNDGIDDLAIGVPKEAIDSIEDAGAVNVIYGTNAGLRADGNQVWHQNTSGIGGAAEAGDQFGAALASGDFNGDGRADLAIGVPNEAIGSLVGAGAVNTIYGSPTGLSSSSSQVWHQNVTGIGGGSEAHDRFGASLTAGDFNFDGRADLAIGVPGEAIGSVQSAGASNVLYGSSAGLNAAGDQLWHQNVSGVGGASEQNDLFGSALVSGDFDGDGIADLAIGVGNESIESVVGAGAVNVLYGISGSGLTTNSSQLWHQNSAGIAGTAEANDGFGLGL